MSLALFRPAHTTTLGGSIPMAHPLAPNTPAPDFALLDTAGKRVRLRGFRGRNLMLAFYPGDWTPVCTAERISMPSRRISRLAAQAQWMARAGPSKVAR